MSSPKYKKIFFKNYPLELKDFLSPDLIEKTISQQNTYGSYQMHSWTFRGIRMRLIDNQYNDYYTFEKENNENLVSLSFNLKGQYLIQQSGVRFIVRPREHNIIFTNGIGNTFQNQSLTARSFSIDFMPDAFLEIISESNPLLQNFAKSMAGDKALVLSQQSVSMDHGLAKRQAGLPEEQVGLAKAIQSILNCPYTGGLKQLFLLSKVIEILVLQGEAHYLVQAPTPKKVQKLKDLEQIFFARQYLFKHMEAPPSLPELSKIVGLNEYKLKKSYKAVFKTSPFAHLAAFRLEMAKEKLLNTQQGISEIGYELGYSSPQHFSMAFKREFGESPRQIRKK